MTGEKRGFQRRETDLQLEFTHQGDSFQALLIDASVSGAMLRCDSSPPKGAIIELQLPCVAEPVPAKVMRREDGAVGVKFIQPGIGVLIAGWALGRSPTRHSGDNAVGKSMIGG